MIRLIPWPYRLLALALLAAALFGAGWVKGMQYGADDHAEFAARVAAQGEAAEARTRATVRRQAAITTDTETTYAQGSTDLRRLHGPGRLRGQAHFDGLKLPAVPDPAAEPDAAAADAGPGAAEPAPDADACAGLRSDAAMTTRQLLFLQGWVEQQAAGSP